MSWVKLDDQFFFNSKIVRAGRDARDLYIAGLAYCAGQLTDGFIPSEALPLLAVMAGVANVQQNSSKLLDVKLWESAYGGYAIHDYLNYNPSKEEVLATREARAEAGARGGYAKADNAKQNPSKVPSKILAKVCPDPSPSPTPTRTGTGTAEEEDARAAAAPSLLSQLSALMIESTGGTFGARETEQVKQMADEGVSVAWLKRSGEICDARGKSMAGLPRWRYQCGIIHNWQTNGYDGDNVPGGNGRSRASPPASDIASADEFAADAKKWAARSG